LFTGSLPEGYITVQIRYTEVFGVPIAPPDFQPVNLLMTAKTDMQPWIAVGKVSGGPLIDEYLPLTTHVNRYPGRDGRSWSAAAFQGNS
jgi:hypothetical protein